MWSCAHGNIVVMDEESNVIFTVTRSDRLTGKGATSTLTKGIREDGGEILRRLKVIDSCYCKGAPFLHPTAGRFSLVPILGQNCAGWRCRLPDKGIHTTGWRPGQGDRPPAVPLGRQF